MDVGRHLDFPQGFLMWKKSLKCVTQKLGASFDFLVLWIPKVKHDELQIHIHSINVLGFIYNVQ